MEIGRTLRDARVSQDIDVTDVESYTKIRAKFLRSLENEEWAMVGDDTLVKSFLRTYAEYLGLDPRPLVEDFTISRGIDDHHGSAIAPARQQNASSAATRAAIGVGLLAVAALLIWLGGSH